MSEYLNYCILLTTPWQNNLKLESALDYCHNLLNSKHKIQTLFLQYDSVNLASTMNVIPDEEVNMTLKWQAFVEKHQLNAHICINSALRRGVVDEAMAKQYHKPCATLSPLFQLSSLGMFFEALHTADRFVQL